MMWRASGSLIATTLLAYCLTPFAFAESPSYAVVVSSATHADGEWRQVVDALVAKHDATVVTYDDGADDALDSLREAHPRYTCFVAQPSEATRDFVAQVHQLTRSYDDDPYTDTFWGILTGFDAENALAIAQHDEPLVVRKVAGGTEVALEMCSEGKWFCELVAGKSVTKSEDGESEQTIGEADSTAAIVEALNSYQPDLFVTSGHATERDWQIGFRYRNGYFKSKAGQMTGLDTAGNKIAVDSTNPKVYLPIGNCLMGHIDGPDAMALAWMNDAGVKQMIGYTVPTWFGYGGWGCLDYFVEQPGRYTFTEAFFANHHALIHAIETGAGNERGLKFDRDVVAFYGDPAWQAKMADGPRYFEQQLVEADGVYTLTITPNRGSASFEPVNTNGSQRGFRPIVAYLPHRVRDVEVLDGLDLRPVVTDDFVLVPNPRECDPDCPYVVTFRASKVD